MRTKTFQGPSVDSNTLYYVSVVNREIGSMGTEPEEWIKFIIR